MPRLAIEFMLLVTEWPRIVELLLSVSEDIIERGLGITSTMSEKSTVRDLYPAAFPLLGEPGGDLEVEGDCLCAGLGLGKEKVVSCGVEGLGGARALATACCLMSSEVSISDAEIACDLLCV